MYGRLSDAQRAVVARHVAGKTVHDLGAGRLGLAATLIELGAKKVLAVDKEPAWTNTPKTGVQYVRGYFRDYAPSSIPVAFASWPQNAATGLHRLLEQAPCVIYLGSNVDWSSCGYPLMWQQLSAREVLEHVPDRPNTLIVYGPARIERPGLPEEYAALDQERMWGYNELYTSFGLAEQAGVNRSLAARKR